MFPVRAGDSEDRDYHSHLALIRAPHSRVYARRKLTPHHADFAQAEDIAQACVVALWQQYPEKRELGEMAAIAIGIARHKIAQFRREQGRESRSAFRRAGAGAARASRALRRRTDARPRRRARTGIDRILLAMLQALSALPRDSAAETDRAEKTTRRFGMLIGISGNIYEMTKRCHKSLLRIAGGGDEPARRFRPGFAAARRTAPAN